MLTSQRSIAGGYVVCTWILIMKAWKEFSQGSQQYDKAQCKTSSICVYGFQEVSLYGFGRILAYQRGALQRFYKFSNKFPKHLNNKERRSYHSNHISNVNYLDKHAFLRIFVRKHQGDKHGIKHMQANHRKHVEQVDTLIHFEFDFNDLESRFIQTHESRRVERYKVHKPSLLKMMGIKAMVIQPNH